MAIPHAFGDIFRRLHIGRFVKSLDKEYRNTFNI